MADQINDHSVAGSAKENIPTQSQPMDNIHGNVEVNLPSFSFFLPHPLLSFPSFILNARATSLSQKSIANTIGTTIDIMSSPWRFSPLLLHHFLFFCFSFFLPYCLSFILSPHPHQLTQPQSHTNPTRFRPPTHTNSEPKPDDLSLTKPRSNRTFPTKHPATKPPFPTPTPALKPRSMPRRCSRSWVASRRL